MHAERKSRSGARRPPQRRGSRSWRKAHACAAKVSIRSSLGRGKSRPWSEDQSRSGSMRVVAASVHLLVNGRARPRVNPSGSPRDSAEEGGAHPGLDSFPTSHTECSVLIEVSALPMALFSSGHDHADCSKSRVIFPWSCRPDCTLSQRMKRPGERALPCVVFPIAALADGWGADRSEG
jgi:hypothetical protein